MKYSFKPLKNLFCGLAAFFLSTSSFSQKDPSYQCSFQKENSDVFIDKYSDFVFTRKGTYFYYITNDQDNIYVNLRVSNFDAKRLIASTGVTVWINADGKKARKVGIKYPSTPPRRGGGNQAGGPPAQNQRNNQGQAQAGQKPPAGPAQAQSFITLIGFDKTGDKIIPSGSPGDFRGSITTPKNDMHYQLVIPVSKLPVTINKDPQEKNEYLVLGIGVEDVEATGGPAPGGDRSGAPGGVRGGAPGGGPPVASSASESQLLTWIENIRLAKE